MNNIIQLKKESLTTVFFISLILISAIGAAPHPKQKHQHDILRRDSYDLENESSADSEKYDLQGSSSFGYGYYSYPYLGSGFYGGQYPYYGGIYGLGESSICLFSDLCSFKLNFLFKYSQSLPNTYLWCQVKKENSILIFLVLLKVCLLEISKHDFKVPRISSEYWIENASGTFLERLYITRIF